jgi:hypothetical protein
VTGADQVVQLGDGRVSRFTRDHGEGGDGGEGDGSEGDGSEGDGRTGDGSDHGHDGSEGGDSDDSEGTRPNSTAARTEGECVCEALERLACPITDSTRWTGRSSSRSTPRRRPAPGGRDGTRRVSERVEVRCLVQSVAGADDD